MQKAHSYTSTCSLFTKLHGLAQTKSRSNRPIMFEQGNKWKKKETQVHDTYVTTLDLFLAIEGDSMGH